MTFESCLKSSVFYCVLYVLKSFPYVTWSPKITFTIEPGILLLCDKNSIMMGGLNNNIIQEVESVLGDNPVFKGFDITSRNKHDFEQYNNGFEMKLAGNHMSTEGFLALRFRYGFMLILESIYLHKYKLVSNYDVSRNKVDGYAFAFEAVDPLNCNTKFRMMCLSLEDTDCLNFFGNYTNQEIESWIEILTQSWHYGVEEQGFNEDIFLYSTNEEMLDALKKKKELEQSKNPSRANSTDNLSLQSRQSKYSKITVIKNWSEHKDPTQLNKKSSAHGKTSTTDTRFISEKYNVKAGKLSTSKSTIFLSNVDVPKEDNHPSHSNANESLSPTHLKNLLNDQSLSTSGLLKREISKLGANLTGIQSPVSGSGKRTLKKNQSITGSKSCNDFTKTKNQYLDISNNLSAQAASAKPSLKKISSSHEVGNTLKVKDRVIGSSRLGLPQSASFLDLEHESTNVNEQLERRDRHYYIRFKRHPWVTMHQNMINAGAHSMMMYLNLITQMKSQHWKPICSADVTARFLKQDNAPDYRIDPCCLYFINYK